MKLLNKTSIYYLLFALPVFAVCSGLLYYFVSSEIKHSLDESLTNEKITIESNLKKGEHTIDLDDEVELKLMSSKTLSFKNYFSDTLIYDSIESEFLPYRVLASEVSDGKNDYEIRIRKSYIESEDLITGILLPVIILFVVLLIGFFLINFWISKKLWHPFYQTLEQLKNYRIDNSSLKFNDAKVLEFSELNSVLTEMIEKIHKDYINQKQFIENASHEIQTPLAVIQTKIELLIQSSTVSEADMLIIQSVYNASNKLSALNKALLLLSKIENNQFKNPEKIYFETSIEKTLENFEDIILLKNIFIKKNYQSPSAYNINPVLADILIGNLLQNAIRHNINNGFIQISLSEKSIIISNTSASSVTDTNELFQRFKKNEASAESIGLGLAIVKEICDNYNIRISYTCRDQIHIFELQF